MTRTQMSKRVLLIGSVSLSIRSNERAPRRPEGTVPAPRSFTVPARFVEGDRQV